VTGDRDLLELEDIGVAVITVRELVERLADAP
jgi:predicted nucleic acid-binding protein